jgi:hypothetical protein
MSLIALVLVLIVVGVLLWVANSYLPMDPTIRRVMNVVVLITVVLFLLEVFGVMQYASQIRVGPGHFRSP